MYVKVSNRKEFSVVTGIFFKLGYVFDSDSDWIPALLRDDADANSLNITYIDVYVGNDEKDWPYKTHYLNWRYAVTNNAIPYDVFIRDKKLNRVL